MLPQDLLGIQVHRHAKGTAHEPRKACFFVADQLELPCDLRYQHPASHQFGFAEAKLRLICADFLAICALLAQALLSISIADAFSWDYLRDEPDKVAQYLSTVLSKASDAGRRAVRRSGELWACSNPEQAVFLCLACGARAVSAERGICMGCGAEGDEEFVGLVEDFEAFERKVIELQRLMGPSTKAFPA